MPHLVATTYLRHTPHLVVVSCRRRRETQSILNPAEFEGRQESLYCPPNGRTRSLPLLEIELERRPWRLALRASLFFMSCRRSVLAVGARDRDKKQRSQASQQAS